MQKNSLIKTCTQLFFIGPIAGWRVMTMAIASAQVISQRSRILMEEPKGNRQRREINGMIQEKFWGTGEATYAALISLIRENTASAIELISSLTEPFISHHNHSCIRSFKNYINFPIVLVVTSLLMPTRFALSATRLFLDGTKPLHKRVTKNARRLSARKRAH